MSTIIYEDPPCKTEEILNLNINFINLQNYLNSLVKNDKEFYSTIVSLSNKVTEIDTLKSELKDINHRIIRFEEKAKAAEITNENIQKKLIELENRLEYNIDVKQKLKKLNFFIENFFTRRNLKKLRCRE